MLTELRRHWTRPALVALCVIVLDQISKAWILNALGPVEGSNRPLLGTWLSFTFVKNTGVAFGLFRGIPHFFTITSVLISIGAIYFYRFHLPNDRRWVQLSVGLIVGGAILLWVDQIDHKPHEHDATKFPLLTYLWIGVAQCLAMIPGVSRSGASIVAAMLLGADKRAAAMLLVLGDGNDADGVTINGHIYLDRFDFLNATGDWADTSAAHGKDLDGDRFY